MSVTFKKFSFIVNHGMVNPELRKRLIDSIEYLRKMDFFKDYSNISSEEILDKILGEEIKYSISWWGEEEGLLHSGTVMDFYDRERYWTKASDFEIDRELIRFDSKRVILEEVETVIDAKMGIAILNRLARISRGVFQPTNVSSRWLTPEGPK